MSENDVTIRFLEAYDYLKNAELVKNQSEFALKLGVSSSLITDIRNGRTKPGINALRGFVKNFKMISLDYLIAGTGKLVPEYDNTPSRSDSLNTVNDIKEAYTPNLSEGKLHPKQVKSLHPTLHPTKKMTLPKVVTVDKTGNDNIVMVPVVARAGYLSGYGDPEYIRELPTYHIPRLQNGTFRAFEVDGHSMTPTVTHGDIVFAEWCEHFDHITDDTVYVIITKTDGIVIKRVLNRISQYGFLVAKSDSVTNKRQYPNLNIPPGDVIELWRAKMHLSADFTTPHSIWDRINDLEAAIADLKGKKPS